MAETLTHEAFARHLKTKFQVQLEADQSVELGLIEVSELKLSPRQEEFSILFLGPNEFFLGQGIRLMEHDEMGQFDLFLVPIRQDDQGYYYEAVFNRILQPEKTAVDTKSLKTKRTSDSPSRPNVPRKPTDCSSAGYSCR